MPKIINMKYTTNYKGRNKKRGTRESDRLFRRKVDCQVRQDMKNKEENVN